ncbi:MAG: hypothetical protein N2234_09495 [Planctomycetota bacterium]|nr:hypothetical protein [Planctomycetota bacterium]
MAKSPRHFYEILGEGGGEEMRASAGRAPFRSTPPPRIPLPTQVTPVQNTITLRKETFVVGVAFFVVLIVVAFIVGRSTAPAETVAKLENVKPTDASALQPPSLIKEKRYVIVAATFPSSRMSEAQEIRDFLLKSEWTNAELGREGDNVQVLLTGYRTKKIAEDALTAIKNTPYKNRKIFVDAQLVEK